MKKIANWFGNNAAKKDPPGGSKRKSGKTSFTIRDVVTINYRDRVYELIDTRMDGSEDQRKWLSLYPQALTDVLAALSPEEVEEAESLVVEWSNKGIPAEKQRVYVLFLLSRQRSELIVSQKCGKILRS
jgi:hypothetical protein